MSVTLLSGVPGVGVSAVSERARKRLDDYELINFGDVMLEEGVTQGVATTRSELAALSRRQTERLQRRAGEYVEDRADSTNVLLSTHLAAGTATGIVPGLPRSVMRDVDPSLIVLVEAEPGTILDRRAESERSFDSITPRRVNFLQDLGRAAAFDYAIAIEASVELIENEDDIETAADELVDVITAVG